MKCTSRISHIYTAILAKFDVVYRFVYRKVYRSTYVVSFHIILYYIIIYYVMLYHNIFYYINKKRILVLLCQIYDVETDST